MPPLLADFIHARGCKPICEKSLTLPGILSTAPTLDTTYRGEQIITPLLEVRRIS